MKPKHFIFTLLALFASINVSADVPEGNITFEDDAVKAICVANWDTNSDGELSYAEAAAVTSIGTIFRSNKSVRIFNELQYFTSLTSIGNSAFGGCNVTSITIPDGVTWIGTDAFNGCTRLASIILPDGLTFIGDYAFRYCYSLASITLPNTVTSIGNLAFANCPSLSSITIPTSLVTIGGGAFDGTLVIFNSTTPCTQGGLGGAKLVVPHAAVDAYRNAWSSIANAIVDADHIEKTVDIAAKESSSAVAETIGEDLLRNVLRLKVKGTFNGYDIMVFRNKMTNLMHLDLSEANVVASTYKYYQSYNSKDNIITGYFAPTNIVSLKLPKDITALENSAFRECVKLKTMELPNGITSVPSYAFYGCTGLTSVSIPESVTEIGDYAFWNCNGITKILFPRGLKTIGAGAFNPCGLTTLHLPPYMESIGNGAFISGSSSPMKSIYAYMPNVFTRPNGTFSSYQTTQLYIPEFLYNNYYYDTGWSQFTNITTTTLSPDDYLKLPTNSDITMGENDQRIPDMSNGEHVDAEINTQGSFTVKGSDPQPFDEVDQILDGEGQGGSLIGEDDGENEGNLRVNTLRVKINVKAGRWYFFCFPYDVTIANCEYPGQYAWRWYDGAERATNGSGGWKPVTGETLTAFEGYAFQTSHTGNLIISFNHPTFGGDRPKTLVAHASANAANASWNLVGNPYSSFYDFLAVDFDAPITVYNSNGTYSAYRPADDECHLQPYEAFFVQKPTEVDAINFDSDRRESYNQGQTKKAERQKARRARGIDPQRQLINLEILCGEKQADRTRVVLNEQKSRDYELDCDASKFLSNEATAQLYTIENGIKMAINERPMEGDIRLGYTAKQAGTLSISASRMDMPMMLFDTQLGITFDLSVGTYDFETQAGTFNDRFELRLSGDATAIKSMKEKTGVCFGTQDGGISIGGAEGKTINVYTTDGKMAAQHSGNGYIALKSGVYVVNVDGVTAKVSVK